MPENFANEYQTTLNGSINNSTTSVVVTSATGAPAPNFRIRVGSEYMLVTGVAGANFTVTRGIEGSSATSHNDGATVTHVVTAGALITLRAPTPWHLVPITGLSHSGNNTLGATNNAIFRPTLVYATCTVTGIRVNIGTSSGNLDVGIYDESFNRLASSGSTAAPGTGLRTISFSASVQIDPGRYWLAIAQNNNTMTYSTFTTVSLPGASRTQATAFPLPSTGAPGGEAGTQTNLIGVVQGGWP